LQTVHHHFNIYASSCVCLGAMMPRWAPQTRYTLWRNTASIMKALNLTWRVEWVGGDIVQHCTQAVLNQQEGIEINRAGNGNDAIVPLPPILNCKIV